MKLIIDISEEEYKEVLEDTYSGTPYENNIFTIIANGKPLPKGHGKLIDVDDLIKRIKKFIDIPDKYISQRNKDFIYILAREEVIIQADKEERRL